MTDRPRRDGRGGGGQSEGWRELIRLMELLVLVFAIIMCVVRWCPSSRSHRLLALFRSLFANSHGNHHRHEPGCSSVILHASCFMLHADH